MIFLEKNTGEKEVEYFHDGTNWVNYGKNLEAFINDNIAQINKKLDMFYRKKTQQNLDYPLKHCIYRNI